jgi:hypothetical protein
MLAHALALGGGRIAGANGSSDRRQRYAVPCGKIANLRER